MLDKYVDRLVQKHASLQEILRNAKLISDVIKQNGGKPLVVGGAVRDKILGKEPKDYDIEVFGLPEDKLIQVLESTGLDVDLVGKSFGVFKVGRGEDAIDVSLPRQEIKTDDGHKGFEVHPNHNLSVSEASKRRDFTFNALMADFDALQDIHDYQSAKKAQSLGLLIDSHGGLEHLQEGTVHHVNDTAFVEDPLRILRAAQFSSRFDFQVDEKTLDLMRDEKLQNEIKTLPRERIEEEIKKLVLKGENVIKGFKLLKDLSILKLMLPELDRLPEGDFHKNLRLMHKAKQKLKSAGNKKLNFVKIISILMVGVINPVKLLSRFLGTLLEKNQIIAILENTPTIEELYSTYLKDESDINLRAGLRRLELKLKKVKLQVLDLLSVVQIINPNLFNPQAINKIKESYNSLKDNIEPFFSGKDLVERGFKPGKEMGEVLRNLHEMQIDELFRSKKEGIPFLEKEISKYL